MLDSNLKESFSHNEVVKCIQVGLLCVQEDPDDRPTMATVISYLNTQLIDLPFPREPALFRYKGEYCNCSDQFSNNSTPSSINDMSKSTFFPR